MNRITISIAGSVLAFVCGIATASSWNRHANYEQPRPNYDQPRPIIFERCPPETSNSSTTKTSISTEAPYSEVAFGPGLRIVPDEVMLKSERLRYDVNIHYPQIIGAEDLEIRQLNQRMKERANKEFQSWFNPPKAELQRFRDWGPNAFNTVDLDYQVLLATDSLFSVYSDGSIYNLGAAHSAEYSFAFNYDLKLRKELKLSDVFKPNSKYLQFVSIYCTEELTNRAERVYLSNEKLEPSTTVFHTWNITPFGIRFSFDACEVAACATGGQEVEIPFAKLKSILNPVISEHIGWQ